MKKIILLAVFLMSRWGWAGAAEITLEACAQNETEVQRHKFEQEEAGIATACEKGFYPHLLTDWSCVSSNKETPKNLQCLKTDSFWKCKRAYVCQPETATANRKLALQNVAKRKEKWMNDFFNSKGPKVNTCQNLPAKISTCEPFECRETHPFVGSFIIQRNILGMKGDVCFYKETMPNNGLMECRYKKASLSLVEGMYKDAEEGTFPAKSGYNPMQTGECKVSGYQ